MGRGEVAGAGAVRVRSERPADHPAVQAIHEAAFGRSAEAELVSALRRGAAPRVCLVAEAAGSADGELAGPVMVSPVALVAHTALAAGGLAPVAVRPERQRCGIGADLVRAALTQCVAVGWGAVFVLGDPAYYRRFGFTLAAPGGLHYESPDFDGAFQVRELVPGAIASCRGWVRYHTAFAEV
jgi:putative acetyltransferase